MDAGTLCGLPARRVVRAVVGLAATIDDANVSRVVHTVISWFWALVTYDSYVACWGEAAPSVFLADGPKYARECIARASWWLETHTQRQGADSAGAVAVPRLTGADALLVERASTMFRKACAGPIKTRLEVYNVLVFGEQSERSTIGHIAELETLFSLVELREMSSKMDVLLSTNASAMDRHELDLAIELKTIADLYLTMYERPGNMLDSRVQTQSFVIVVGLLACAGGANPTDVRNLLGSYTSGRLLLDAIGAEQQDDSRIGVPASAIGTDDNLAAAAAEPSADDEAGSAAEPSADDETGSVLPGLRHARQNSERVLRRL